MPITYNINIPNPPDRPSASQPQILANFQGINAIMDVNHYTFASVDAGKHKFIQLPIVNAAPATAPNELALYTKLEPLTNANQMYIKRSDGGAEIPFTAFNIGASPEVLAAQGYSWLPSGLLMKFGRSQGAITMDTQIVTVDLTVDISFVSIPLAVFLTPIGTNVANFAVYVRGLGATGDVPTSISVQVVIRDSNIARANDYDFSWVAIGRGV